MKNSYIIGIDPDTDKSGLAVIDTEKKVAHLDTLPFPNLIDRVNNLYREASYDFRDPVVIVEASHLIAKSNWHEKQGKRGEKIAKNVGACHQTGKLIIEMLKFKGCTVIEQRPLRKCWKGVNGKITHEEIKELFNNIGFDFPNKSNSEVRDAALIALNYSKLPLIIKNAK